MLKSCVRISILGTNPLFKAPPEIINFSGLKRHKSSNIQHAINFDHLRHGNFPDILKSQSHGKHENEKETTADRESEPIIKCKRPEFNHFRNQKYKDFSVIPLASKGWRRTKSKGDHFSILLNTKDFKSAFKKEPKSFANTKLDQTLIEILSRNGVQTPTEIQSKAIPHVLAGKTCLIAAETGCGKTIAYLVPIIQQILKFKHTFSGQRDTNSPFGLIITPGRDLAEQIYEVARWFSRELDLECKVIIGGRCKKKMYNSDFDDVDLLISSLGALSKFTTNGIYSMTHVKHVVLDEADTLLDDSFNEKLIYFLRRFQFASDELQNDFGAQLVLASATMPTSLAELLKSTVDLEKLEKITTSNLHFIMPHVKQTFCRVGKSEKPAYLLQYVKEAVKNKLPTIIFSNKTASSDFVNIFLNENNIKCVNLNGDLRSDMRIDRFKMFQNGEVDILSTTDVCSRGLDTKRAQRILNFDMPSFISDYIHRCGRTGRVGSPKNCEVINLVSNNFHEVKLTQEIELAVRMMTSFHNVNANIGRILEHRTEKKSRILYEISNQPPSFK